VLWDAVEIEGRRVVECPLSNVQVLVVRWPIYRNHRLDFGSSDFCGVESAVACSRQHQG